MRTRLFFAIALVLLSAFVLSEPTWAANLSDQVNAQINAGAGRAGFGSARTPQEVIASFIEILLSLLGTFFLVLTIYSGYLLFTARGEEEKVSKAKKTLRSAIIGLFIVLSAYSITLFVTRIITTSTYGDPARPADGSGYEVRCQGLDCELLGK